MYCKNCGKEIAPNASVCLGCGVRVGEGSNFCQNCGSGIAPNAAVCVKCGCSVVNIPVGAAQKSKLAAGLLGIFLGGLGIHNFYLGYTGKAVA